MVERRSDMEFALQLADEADAMTMAAYTGQALHFEDKADGSPVTEHDRLVEKKLRAMVEDQRPRDGFLGEETGSSPGAARRWIIDPIDGTASFIRGGRSWATQIALEEDGELVLGVTSAPVVEARWWGADGMGAFRQAAGEPAPVPLHVSSTTELAQATWVCYPRIDRLSGEWRTLPDRLSTASAPIRPTSHGALMVAAGQTDACLQLDGALWDYAAFAAIVRVAGGAFSYVDESSERGGPRPAVFSNGRVHDEVLTVLTPR